MMMETIRMQPTMPHQQQTHHLHQMVFRPPEPDIANILGMDMSGSGAVLTIPCTPGPDFQLIDLHQTLDSILNNNPNNAMCGRTTMPHNGVSFADHSQQYSNMGVPTDAMWFPAFNQIRPPQMTQSQPYQFDNGNAGYAAANKNSNKRMSVDFNGNITEFSGDPWTNSPRAGGTLDEPSDNSQTQMKAGLSKDPGNFNFPNGTKRQNVGHRPNMAPGHHLISTPQMNCMAPRGPLRQLPPGHNQANFQYHPQRPMYLPSPSNGQPFYTLPRIPDLTNHPQPLNRPNLSFIQQPRSHMTQVFGPRMPPPPAATHQTHQHQFQQQNFYFTGLMGPPANAPVPSDPSQNEKKARFQRTAQILEQSGLMDCTLKTAALIRENAGLQREIDAILAESNHLINQHLVARNSSQQPVFENQLIQQQNQPQQNQQQRSISMPLVIYPDGMV